MAMALFLAGCTGGDDVAVTEQAIGRFHKELNAGAFVGIHQNASAEWKEASSEPASVELFNGVRRKLGKFVSGKQSGWKVNYGTAGTIVVLQYDSKFEKGDAQETFTYRRSGDRAELIGYNINSRALITG
jgi:hypothetical protein